MEVLVGGKATDRDIWEGRSRSGRTRQKIPEGLRKLGYRPGRQSGQGPGRRRGAFRREGPSDLIAGLDEGPGRRRHGHDVSVAQSRDTRHVRGVHRIRERAERSEGAGGPVRRGRREPGYLLPGVPAVAVAPRRSRGGANAPFGDGGEVPRDHVRADLGPQ